MYTDNISLENWPKKDSKKNVDLLASELPRATLDNL